MSANLRAYTKALYGFDHVMRLVPADAWSNPSPCEGWTARDVVGHVIAVQRYIEALVRGVPPEVNPYETPGEIAGHEPGVAWAAVRDEVLALLDEPGVIRRSVHTFRGDESVDEQLGWNVVDTLTHAWDLARAAGVDDRLDPGSVAHALAQAEPVVEHMRHPHLFGSGVEAHQDADPQTRLLALLGRSAA